MFMNGHMEVLCVMVIRYMDVLSVLVNGHMDVMWSC